MPAASRVDLKLIHTDLILHLSVNNRERSHLGFQMVLFVAALVLDKDSQHRPSWLPLTIILQAR